MEKFSSPSLPFLTWLSSDFVEEGPGKVEISKGNRERWREILKERIFSAFGKQKWLDPLTP